MRDPNFTSIDEMRDPDFISIDNPNMDLNTSTKDNWQEANEAQGYNLANVSGIILKKVITTQR